MVESLDYQIPITQLKGAQGKLRYASSKASFFLDWEVPPSGDYNILSCGCQTVFSVMGVREGMENFFSIGIDETNTFRGRGTLLKQTCTAKDLKNLIPTL